MVQHVFTLNAGSSSIKFALFEGAAQVAGGEVEMTPRGRRLRVGALVVEWAGEAPFHADALGRILAWRGEAFAGAEVVAVGHRVVHGGVEFSAPVEVDAGVMARLEALVPLAPLHQPHNLACIRAAQAAWPGTRQVACFDTAFHRGHPFVNDTFALPRRFYAEGVRRYGFHGLSYEYVAGRLAAMAPEVAGGRVVMAHLGNGASMCATLGGRSVASSMGFTALDGLPMGTRCGQIDPGVVLYLMQHHGMSAAAVSDLLYKESGLKGLSGISGDMRALEASGAREAGEAIDYFTFRIRRELGGLAAVLGGIDAVVFCGGIGEHSALVRGRVLEGMAWLGIVLDPEANRANAGVISAPGSAARVFVIATDEEAMIARHTREVLKIV